jgi:hypothetical protein
MAYAKTSLRSKKRQLRESMRAAGLDYRQIVTEFSRVYRLRPRAAWREAYGWSLQEAADIINSYRGDTGLDPGGLSGMTASHLCEYESWPGYREVPSGRKPSSYLIAVLASIYDCQVSDLIDLADRQHFPKADLLILDTYTRHSNPAPSLTEVRHDIPQVPTNPTDTDGNSYVILALPPGTQRIVIDVMGTDEDEQSAVSQPAHRLTLVGK